MAEAGLWPSVVVELYGIPLAVDGGEGQCVGIIALGGGYLQSDLTTALAEMGRPVPTVVEQSVAGGVVSHHPSGNKADQELALDLQVLATVVPAARIVVYFAPNQQQGLVEAVRQAVRDDVNRPQVLSLSWGSAEHYWPPAVRDAMETALAEAVQRRVTVVAASGDLLATAGEMDGKAHVQYPASSPYVLGCGGTRVTVPPDAFAEAVWNNGVMGSGGGISDVFPVPEYQAGMALPPSVNDGGRRRGVPDVSAAAAEVPGYRTIVAGAVHVQPGTSAATPLWAGLITLANAARGQPVGLVHPLLYANPAVFRPVTAGHNRIGGIGYDAGPGWSACTGLGSPRGSDVIAALSAVA